MSDPVFTRTEDGWSATELARGPWHPEQCHGGAPAALLAALVDTVASPTPMQGVRLTLELLRPVPLGPLRATTSVLRDGRRVQVVEVGLDDGVGNALVRGRALRIRTASLDLPDPVQDGPIPDGPDGLERFGGHDGWPVGFWTALDVRMSMGELGQPGPGAAWFRFDVPLAEDVELTPLARVAAAADFGNGIGSPLEMGPWLYVNPDLTVSTHRLPEDEWVGIRASSVAQATGTGLTTTELFDRTGRIGTATQSLYIDQGR